MITRVLRFEVVGLRRTYVVPVTVLFAIGGAVIGRTFAWFRSLLQSSDIEGLFLLDTLGTEIAVPLALLALIIAAGYVFGRDLGDGTAEVVLTAPVSRESILIAKLLVLLVWTLALAVAAGVTDGLLYSALALSPVDPGATISFADTLKAGLAAFALLPLVGWVALRFRSVVGAVGGAVALFVAAFSLRSVGLGSLAPWNAPSGLVLGESSLALVVGPLVVFLLGVGACLWQMRHLDLA